MQGSSARRLFFLGSHLSRLTSQLQLKSQTLNRLHFSLKEGEIVPACEFSFLRLLLMGPMSSRCCLKMQSMKVLLPRPLKVTAVLSRATLSRSVKSKNQAHISWESCCASPRASLCVCAPAHLIYKRSIEICMSPHDACTKNTLK